MMSPAPGARHTGADIPPSGHAFASPKRLQDTDASKVADYNILRGRPKLLAHLNKPCGRGGEIEAREEHAEAEAVEDLAHKRKKE